MKNTTKAILLFLFAVLIFATCSHGNQPDPPKKEDVPWTPSTEDIARFKANGFVRYSDFKAKGDGTTDDMDAIVATHVFANEHNLTVKGDDGFTYYISGKSKSAVIRTNTDFGTASFVIDDTNVENRNTQVFIVSSTHRPLQLYGLNSLRKNQEKINVTVPGSSIITVTNTNVKQYIRLGVNQDEGSPQTDIFIVDQYGNVDVNTPIIWDFDQITNVTALPIDETNLTISGGKFTTIANKAESKYTYYARGISVRRSNVLIDGIEHRVIGEGEQGAPYTGFLDIGDCANITVRNALLTGRKMYSTAGAGGAISYMGSYDILVHRALNVSFINCSQTNDINDSRFWGIMGSNYTKNLLYDNCTFSRFDAHMGVANATIRNSRLGHQGISIIGSGTFTVENTTVNGSNFITLRSDYGSAWQGNFIIRDCIFVPVGGRWATSASLIGGANNGKHNFGYVCYMPEHIYIENLYINDSKQPANYFGPAVFADFNPQMTSSAYIETFPYIKTQKVCLVNVTTASGKKLRSSDNTYMFKDVVIKEN